MNVDNNTIEDLDLSWINDFEKIDNEYKNYYSEELSFIKIHAIYINNCNEIEKIKEDKILLKTPGVLQKEELLSIIKHNIFSNQVKYFLLSILKFNISLEPMYLKTFLKNTNPKICTPFLKSIKNLDTIKFEKSITMFHDINELLIIFHQKNDKIKINSQEKEIHSKTKKAFANSNLKKKTKKRT